MLIMGKNLPLESDKTKKISLVMDKNLPLEICNKILLVNENNFQSYWQIFALEADFFHH